jgi:hypothetical protein
MADLDRIRAADAERARLDHAIQQMSGPGQAARVILNDDRLALLRELAALRAEAEKLRGENLKLMTVVNQCAMAFLQNCDPRTLAIIAKEALAKVEARQALADDGRGEAKK